MDIPPDVRARREKDALRKRKARYDEIVSNRNAEATRAREILEVELSRMREDAFRESSLIREQAIEEARQIRNHAMVESEAIFRNALRRLGNGIMQSRSHDLLDQAKITAQELVREAHLEAYALIEEAKATSLEAESNAADIVAHARSRAGEIETQALQNARDKEETVPDLVERTRTRRERDAARKRAKYWREKELEKQLGLGCERVSSVRSVRTARGVASELVKLFHPASNLSITWDTFEYVTLDSSDKNGSQKKPIKRLRMVKRTTSTSDFIQKLKDIMPVFVKHNFIARWQGEQYRACLATFPRGTVVSSIDFSENYTFKVQNEVQSLHWDNKQITMLVLITRRHKDDTVGAEQPEPDTRELVSDYHFFISDDFSLLSSLQHCLDKHWTWMAENNILVNRHWMWSDGCAAQFKACRPFFFVSKYYNKYGAPLTWHFHGSGHGKDIGFLTGKFELDQEMAYGQTQNVRRFFWEIKVGEVDRSKELDCLPIKGTRSLHCFHGYSRVNPTLLKTRELSCFCPSCVDDEGVNCPNKRYTGDWKLENVHPLKLTDVSAYAEELGAGLGQATDWGEGSIADLVEVGKFFAVEAEASNEFNADFWIMQCSKPLYQLEEDETDDYGNTVYSGDFALQAIWYQQWGRRGTCFIRYGASPESIVRAQDVIHIKFALQPTGTVSGSPSFTLNADTLAEITLSLKR
ncbi:hypothetical protein R1sor_010679 [Riccia sorocarpa]|uniref:Uncharacterized protein n=1 Tax=Riccia sorocarpa TaxID=122646 RepID=A0ABD3HYS4_9MARC